jgi:uncharacterized protein (UPF0276 family)
VIQLTTNLSDPLLELIRDSKVPIDGVEVGPWFSLSQTRAYRKALPDLPFTFHGGDLIDRVGWVPGATGRIAAYLRCTGSPWVSVHVTLWPPGTVWLMLKRGWRVPLPDPTRAARRFVRQVKRLARAVPVPVLLENVEPLPFDGYDFEVQTERITQVLEETDSALLLDVGHARVSAAALGVDERDYLGGLPLQRVVQIHVSGPRKRDGRLVDAHEPLQEIDYALLDYVLARSKPRMVTLEYTRVRDPLREQLLRLRDVLDSRGGR